MSEVKLTKGRLEVVSRNYTKELLKIMLQENSTLYVDGTESDFIPVRNSEHFDIEFIYNKGVLYQVVEFEYEDFQDELIQTHINKEQTDINFTYIYYNGGTCFEEIIEEGLNKL